MNSHKLFLGICNTDITNYGYNKEIPLVPWTSLKKKIIFIILRLEYENVFAAVANNDIDVLLDE